MKDTIQILDKKYFACNFEFIEYKYDRLDYNLFFAARKNALLVNINFVKMYLAYIPLENDSFFDLLDKKCRNILDSFEQSKHEKCKILINDLVLKSQELNTNEQSLFKTFIEPHLKDIEIVSDTFI